MVKAQKSQRIDQQAATLAEVWEWAKKVAPVSAAAWQADGPNRIIRDLGQLKAAARWAFDQPGSAGLVLSAKSDKTDKNLPIAQRVMLPKEPAYDEVADIVPTMGPMRPPLAFVGTSPSLIDAARGEPFCGPDGRYLLDHYLAPLGLAKNDVVVTHLYPQAGEPSAEELVGWSGWVKEELRRHDPALVIALGKIAKEQLGALADMALPHPAAVRRKGDSGEVARKLRLVKERLLTLQAPAIEGVKIGKADGDKHIAFGVVLDGYQFDSQGSWIPASAIEETAHKWLTQSRIIGVQHTRMANAVPVESWLWPYPSQDDYRAAMQNLPHKCFAATFGKDTAVHSGSWVLGVKVLDEELWRDIDEGRITAYSIGGSGIEVPASENDMPEVTYINA